MDVEPVNANKRLPFRSFMRLLWLRVTTNSSKVNLNKLHSSNTTLLRWMSYSVYSTAGVDRLTLIHKAWFDYRNTIRIKIEALRHKRYKHYLSVWFAFKRKRSKKLIRRLLRWTKK